MLHLIIFLITMHPNVGYVMCHYCNSLFSTSVWQINCIEFNAFVKNIVIDCYKCNKIELFKIFIFISQQFCGNVGCCEHDVEVTIRGNHCYRHDADTSNPNNLLSIFF